MGWNGTGIKKTNMRLRGAKSYLRCRTEEKWFCAGCGKDHSAKTERVAKDGKLYCWSRFYKL